MPPAPSRFDGPVAWEKTVGVIRAAGAARRLHRSPAETRALSIVNLVEEFRVASDGTIYVGDTHHDVRQARKAGVISAVKTGGQALKHLHKIHGEKPDHLLDSFCGLCGVIRE